MDGSYLVLCGLHSWSVLGEDHSQGKKKHEQSMTHITKHHSEEKGECDDGVGSRVDFPVSAHTIGIHNALEAGGKAVGPDEGWRHVLAGDAVSDSTHSFLTLGYPGRETEADARAY